MSNTIELYQEPQGRTTIQLNPADGERLRTMIAANTNKYFSQYAAEVGFAASNASAYLTGRKRISIETLMALLAGTTLRAECTIHLRITDDASGATSTQTEDTLCLEGMVTSAEVLQQMGNPVEAPIYCSSGFEQPNKTQPVDSPSAETNTDSLE